MQKLTAIFLFLLCLNCDDRNPVKDKTLVYSAKDLAFVNDLVELNESLSYTLESQIKQDMTVVIENGESLYRITQLNLAEQNISLLPESIGNLDSLIFLNIEENLISEILDTVCSLTQLQETLTNGNKLCVPGNYPSCLSSDINIYLQDCESYPDENDQEFIGELIVMNGVEDSLAAIIHNERVTWSTVLEEYGLVDRITELDLAYLMLDTLPFSIGGLNYLDWLELENNQLTSIPESFGALDSLHYLGLYNNQISSLPQNISQLTNLEEMYLYSNQLNSLDFDFSQMNELDIFWISHNQISSIDSSFCDIYQNLDEFFYSQNQLCENLPPCLENIVNPSEQDCGD